MDYRAPLLFRKSSEEIVASLIVAGDWAPIRIFAPVMAGQPEAIYGDLLPILRSTDLRVVNVEAPLSDGTPALKSGTVFHGEAEHLAALTAVPFEVATLANNHTFDSGIEGFLKTRTLLDAAGIRTLGAGCSEAEASAFLPLEVNGIRIALFNLSEGEDETAALGDKAGVHGWQPEKIVETIRRERGNFALIIVIAHCGLEYIPFPPPYVYEAFQCFADAGADVVIGHHPHVPQGMCIRNQVPLCFSLGNFAFYQETDLKYRKLGYMLKIAAGRSGLVSLEVIPYAIHAGGLALLEGAQLDEFARLFQELSLPLAGADGVLDAWHGFLAYYGELGYFQELGRILQEWEKSPGKGAAMLRNRLLTLQHYWHWHDGLNRIVDGSICNAKAEYIAFAQRYFTEKGL
ncbi:MAG: CapA family protein [Oligosphaeraceae bacterium]|nr:CapA family protein [Oligosphaeraceae bacterium]